MAGLRAVIFDFDGVLADTESLHFRALREVVQGEGMSLTEEEYKERYLALDDRGFFERFLADR
ncbi:MAG: HAD hydrolase-like protein, partial [Nitrospinota bacterium]